MVVLSPHSVMYADYFHISPGTGAEGDFGRFRAPHAKVRVTYDRELVRLICQEADRADVPAGTMGEEDRQLDHGTMIPLWFLNQYDRNYQVVRIGLSGLPFSAHYRLGQCIQRAAERSEKRIAVIASGDLSHRLTKDGPYGFQEEGPAYDRRIMDVMGSGEFGGLFDFSEEFCEKAAECGHRSFVIMAGALDSLAVKAERLSHEGPFGVGYGMCIYEAGGGGPAPGGPGCRGPGPSGSACAAWLRAWAFAAKSSAMARRCASSRPSCSARSALAASVALRCAASISRIACIKSFRSFMLSPRKESLLPFRDLL